MHLAAVGCHNSVHQPIPNAGFAPAIEAVVGGRVGAVALGQVAPGRSRSQDEKDRVENTPVVCARHAPRLVGQKRLDDPPLRIAQVKPRHLQSSANTEVESGFGFNRNPVYEYRT